jgi:hypothetical protein
MGVTLWIFIVNEDDSIKRFPMARFERLIEFESKERIPRYARKRVRYVEVALELEHRKPINILQMLYLILPFDSRGRVDAKEQDKERRLAADMMPPIVPDRGSGKVIEAQHRFARKRFDNEYRWEPTPEIEAAILEAIFGAD